MSPPSPAPSPQLYTPDNVQALLLADFQARGISAAVEVGEWDPELQRGEPRIIIGYGRGRVGEPGGHYMPGAMWSPPGTTGLVARALLDDAQRLTFLVHAPGQGTAEGAAPAARRATDQLFRATLAALRRMIAGPFREPADVEWPKGDDPRFAGYEGFVYGSIALFELVMASPILDDPEGVIAIASVSNSVTAALGDGTITPPETISGPTS